MPALSFSSSELTRVKLTRNLAPSRSTVRSHRDPMPPPFCITACTLSCVTSHPSIAQIQSPGMSSPSTQLPGKTSSTIQVFDTGSQHSLTPTSAEESGESWMISSGSATSPRSAARMASNSLTTPASTVKVSTCASSVYRSLHFSIVATSWRRAASTSYAQHCSSDTLWRSRRNLTQLPRTRPITNA